jgi:lipoprotein-anchoring transpeptidase ErfK/SrfK
MYLVKHDSVEKTYRISSSKYGIGSRAGSNKTPLGVHRIAEKIGSNAEPNTIFAGRKNTGKLATIIKDSVDVQADDVTSRILWLDGLEPGVNKGKGIDSHSRYIYIHGTPEEGLIGTPASHGCIRMYNRDIIELFDLVKVGTLVLVEQGDQNKQ